jgi:hypothetical protein
MVVFKLGGALVVVKLGRKAILWLMNVGIWFSVKWKRNRKRRGEQIEMKWKKERVNWKETRGGRESWWKWRSNFIIWDWFWTVIALFAYFVFWISRKTSFLCNQASLQP